MKIAVCGEYYSPNLGDPVIVESMVHVLKKTYINSEITIIDIDGRDKIKESINKNEIIKINKSSMLKRFPMLKSIKVFSNWILKDKRKVRLYFKENLKDIDFLVIAGGQLVMNNNLYFPLRLQELILQAEKYNIPVIFNSCGVQRYNKINYGVYLLKKALNNNIVKIATTRDDIEMLKKYLPKSNKVIGKNIDVAVWCNEAYNIKRNSESNIIGLGIIEPIAYKKYYERTGDRTYYITEEELRSFWIDLIKILNKNELEWKIFCNGSMGDYEFGLSILKEMNFDANNINKFIAPRPMNPEELVNQISQFKSIISQRLHSHIIAFSLGIPIVGLIWDKKTIDFAEMVKLDNKFFNIKESNAELIYKHHLENSKYEYKNLNDEFREQATKYVKMMKKYI